MTTLRQVGLLTVLALVPALAAALWHPGLARGARPALRPHEVTIETVQTWRGPILWLDARPAADYERGHVPGALLLNEAQWESQLTVVLDAWQPGMKTIVYCGASTCEASAAVARRLRDDFDLAEVYFLHGGWSAWQHAQQ